MENVNVKSKCKTRGRGKTKGNCYERKLANILSWWMFNLPNILYKHENSGGRKIVYTGDITPNDVEHFPWNFWPFVIEAKNGYQKHIPTLMNQNKLRFWIIKLLNERTETQKIPFLICQFHKQIPILLTNIILNLHSDISLAIPYNNTFEIFYVYKFNDLINQKFYTIIPDWFPNVVGVNEKDIEIMQEPSVIKKYSKKKKKPLITDDLLDSIIHDVFTTNK